MPPRGKTKARSCSGICFSFNWEPKCRLGMLSSLYSQFSFGNFYYYCLRKCTVQKSFGDDRVNHECCFHFIYTIQKGINGLQVLNPQELEMPHVTLGNQVISEKNCWTQPHLLFMGQMSVHRWYANHWLHSIKLYINSKAIFYNLWYILLKMKVHYPVKPFYTWDLEHAHHWKVLYKGIKYLFLHSQAWTLAVPD